MRYTTFDIEADALLVNITVIHCLSYQIWENSVEISRGTITNYEEMILFILEQETFVGHNIIKYDIPAIEKILNIKVEARLIDTLALSWYLYPLRPKHGLEGWGEDFGVPKPIINKIEWAGPLPGETLGQFQNKMKHRCESDVKINQLLWQKQLAYLFILYNGDMIKINNLINYLGFKLDCAREQEEVGCKINRKLVEDSLVTLDGLREEKIAVLTTAMPLNITYKEIKKPSKVVKADGSMSVAGEKWLDLLDSMNLPRNYSNTVMRKESEELGNPASSAQVKDWLYSLGWVPITFEHRKNKAGDVKAVPQIYGDNGVCESIKRLYPIEPAFESLDMLSLINHRIGVFHSFLENIDERDYVQATISGFTNTLRFKHKKPIVNLPSIYKFYGSEIRGSIVSPSEEYLLCGSDMSSLEDSTKQHYMYYYDPEYVKQMRVPGFDPHLDIAVLAGMLTVEQAEAHKLYSKTKGAEGTSYSEIRGKAKTVNFAGVYGAGPPKIAQSTGMPLQQAQQLHKTYWKRNKSVKQIAAACIVKTISTQMWLYNPVSGFWYSLRYDKDKFSTLNQGTGVFCFDMWVREVRRALIRIMLQYHDEIGFPLLRETKEDVEKKLLTAITKVNEMIKLNVSLGISVDFGNNYAEIH